MKPYPAYKASGMPWLGNIPTHWETTRTKNVFRLRIEKAPVSNNMELLSVYTHIGVKPRKELEQRGNKASTTDGYWIVKKGDIISNKLLAWMGAIGISHYDGVTSPAYDVLNNIQNIDSDYYHYLFRTNLYLQQFKSVSRGIMDMRLRLYFDQFGNIQILVPHITEQSTIVKFLHWKTIEINKLIRNKRSLITLLKEQKQNIINTAVTRGLDPNVKMKPSGVDWLGDIPEHWEMRRLKYITSINKHSLSEATNKNYTFKYIDIGSVETGYLAKYPETIQFSQAPSRARRIVRKGDTILSTVRTYLKAVYYFPDDVEDTIASTGFAVFTPHDNICASFLGFLLQQNNFISRVIGESTGVAYPAILETKLATFHVAYPKSIDEQQAIVDYIDNASKGLNAAISRAEREIELMREYRERLIADVVTGQIDVRGIEVPEVSDSDLTLDEISDIPEVDDTESDDAED